MRRLLRLASVFVLSLWAVQATGIRAQTLPSPGPAGREVFVPSFWDPHAMPERPKPGTLEAIHFLTEDDYPPFGFTLADGTLFGFNVDLARALCDELQVTCTIQARRYDTLIGALDAGSGDAVIASLAITAKARRVVDFTAPYYRTPARFLARQDAHIAAVTPDSLAGRKVAVEKGSAHEAFLRTFFPKVIAVPLATAPEAWAAVRNGTADLAFSDGIATAQWLNGPEPGGCCGFVGGPYLESRFFGEGAGIAVRKGNHALRDALDYALARLAARGIYTDLTLKYFPVNVY